MTGAYSSAFSTAYDATTADGYTHPYPPIAGTPDLDAVKDWLGITDTQDDALLTVALAAAKAAQADVVTYPLDADGAPFVSENLAYALLLRTQRYAARRNSPEGVIGLQGTGGDFTAARVPFSDVDVLHLEGPHRKIPIA